MKRSLSTMKPFIIDSGDFWAVWRIPATNEYDIYVNGDYIGSDARVLRAVERARALVLQLIQDGMIGDATLHMDAAA